MLPRRLTRYQTLTGAAVLACTLIVAIVPSPLKWGLCALVAFAAGGITALGVMRPSWQFFGPVVCQVPTTRRFVALTFDDGPAEATTGPLLDLLRDRGVRVTFFWVGQRVAECRDLVRRAVAEGHQVENHSWSHHRWTNLLPVADLRSELERTQAILTEATGRPPVWFRPPMGLMNPRVARVTRELDLRVVGWTARGKDQCEPEPDRVVERLLEGLQPGAILLLHDAGLPAERMLAVVEKLVDRLKAAGYQCVPLDSLWTTQQQP